ncbi:MAG TPA: LmeA family phospholipid-binding protein [Solirubrobacteraceae bacterium]|jgi:hypothetical protein|nr:LmeA family phospholipid-binding protein [Solirubrobacteraceae bacterium]
MRRVGRGHRIIRPLIGVALAALLLLALAQLLLPRLAASRISSRVARYGSVEHVGVSAWPAVELLWGHADSVTVRAHSLSLTPAQAAKLLWEGRNVQRIQLDSSSVRLGNVQLTGARLRKRGSSLTAGASIDGAAVRAALPPGFAVGLVRSEGGTVQVSASGGLFGVGATVQAVAEASEGRLVVHPLGSLLQGFSLTLFADPRVYVEAVGAGVLSSSPPSYRLTMRARLR